MIRRRGEGTVFSLAFYRNLAKCEISLYVRQNPSEFEACFQSQGEEAVCIFVRNCCIVSIEPCRFTERCISAINQLSLLRLESKLGYPIISQHFYQFAVQYMQ